MAADHDRTEPSVRAVAALVAANSSLFLAALVYMGWSYMNALWTYFHINPLSQGVSVLEYMLQSSHLFTPAIVVASILFILITSSRTSGLRLKAPSSWASDISNCLPKRLTRFNSSAPVRYLRTGKGAMIAVGATTTVVGILAFAAANYVYINTYWVLVIFSIGPLTLTWPNRTERHGRIPYSVAITVSAVCVLWAGSLYASNKGIEAAQQVVRNLPEQTAVAVYSQQPLALAGPQVTVQDLGHSFQYKYRYLGLRLFTVRAGTYYLLPVGWTQQEDYTYVLTDSDQVRIELYSGEVIDPSS